MSHRFHDILEPDDLRFVRRIADSIWPETFRDILSPNQITYMMSRMYGPGVLEQERNDGAHFALLFSDGEEMPIAFLQWSAYSSAPASTAKLHKLYLLSAFHGKGFGQLLLHYACRQVRQFGFSFLRLNVNKNNTRAIQAYRRHGFRISESVKIDIGSGFFMDDYVMTRDLTDLPDPKSP